MVEFGEFVEADPNKKGVTKLQVRMSVDAGATVSFYIQYDSTGEWEQVAEPFTANVLRSYYIPLIPTRADHFKLRINATGGWRLYSLVIESYSGSELKSQPGRQ